MTPLTLVIDQGTHATRALAFDEDGKVHASAFCEVALRGSGTAFVEQDGDEIIASMQAVVREVLADATVRRRGVARAGLTTQRSTVVAWDRRTGKPLGPVLSWQDRRVAEWLNPFGDHAGEVQRRTGLRLSPHYGAGKLRWYLDHLPAVARAERGGYLAFGPLASFLLFHLLERAEPPLVDHVNASRTQLWNLSSRDWDPWLLDLFDVPAAALPELRPVCAPYGRLRAAAIPLTAVNGDQNSAIYSLGRPNRNTAIVNLGTGAFILLLTGKRLVRHSVLLSGLASSSEAQGEYLIEGTVNGAGAALDWAASRWGPLDMSRLSDWLSRPEEPPVFINTIGGLGSPWWKPGPAPTLVGDGEPWQRAVAVAESIVFMVLANLEAMDQAGLKVHRLQVSGGLARINPLCQRLADLAQRPVYRPVETEATARGIAWLAAGAPGYWPKPGRGRVFNPQPNPGLSGRYQEFRRVLG